jgi:hypothetical protein
MGRVAADRELFAMQMEVALSQADAGVTGDSYVQKLWNQAAKFQQELHETLINEDIADVLLNGGVRNRQEAKRAPGEIESTTIKAMEESLPGQVYERGGEMQLTPEEEYGLHPKRNTTNGSLTRILKSTRFGRMTRMHWLRTSLVSVKCVTEEIGQENKQKRSPKSMIHTRTSLQQTVSLRELRVRVCS